MDEKRVTDIPLYVTLDRVDGPARLYDDPYCLPGGVVVTGGSGLLTPVDSYMVAASVTEATWRVGR